MGSPLRSTRFRDPREEEPWFQRLPPGHKARFRRGFEAERREWELAVGRERRAFRTCVLQAAALFAVAHVLGGCGGAVVLLLATLAGAVVGVAWWRLQVEQLLAPILAMPVFFGLELLAVTSGLGDGSAGPLGFIGFALVTFALGAFSSWLARERHAL